jgi:hypothetical protein
MLYYIFWNIDYKKYQSQTFMVVQIAPIMSPPPKLGCAIHPDGSLKNASEIDWHFDKDDNAQFTVTEKSPKSGPSQTLHPFFLGQASPALLVAGSS